MTGLIDLFCASLKRCFEQIKGGDPLKGLREKAWDHFLELGLPEKKQEAFQYISMNPLYEESFRLAPAPAARVKSFVYPECQHSHLVFVNGYFEPDLSDMSGLPEQIVVLPMLEAMRSYGTFLQNRWSKSLKEETDPFAILNLALHPKGAFVYVPPKLIVDTPIQCIQVVEGDNILSLPRLQIFVASQSEVKWISTPHLQSGWTNGVVDLALESGASFDYISHSGGEKWQFEAFRATLKRDSRLKTLGLSSGGEVQRQSIRVNLGGENSEATLQGAWILEDHRQAHTHVIVDHEAPHTHSMQRFKGVLSDVAQSSFEGKILVRQAAQKTEAYQLNHNLVLGDHALANSKPNLEIFADDVKASHGATVSQLDEEHLFYLRSRGLSKAEAKILLTMGFCKEILDQIPYPTLREEVMRDAKDILRRAL